MNPTLLPPPLDNVAAPLRAPVATSLSGVIRALVLLRVRTLLRPKLMLRFVAICLGLCAITAVVIQVSNNQLRDFTEWSVELFLLRIVPLLCLVTGGGALRNEIRAFTVEYLWTRPARKSHLAIGAYAGAVVVVFVQVLVFTVLIHLVGAVLGVSGVWTQLPLTLLASLGAVLAFCAIAVALGAFTGKYMVFGLIYGVAVEIGLSDLPTRLNQLAVTRHLQSILQSGGTDVPVLLGGVAGCLVLAAVGLTVAAVLFTRLTYRIGDEKEA